MPVIKKIEPIVSDRKPRVCAYVRVSTDNIEQLHSFEFQKQYWDNKFKRDKSVEYVGMFSDEGISGHKTIQRKGFMEVLNLARQGEIDEVHTKSFTRFSRNMVDALDSIEMLRSYGVKVIFEKENVDSLNPNSRLTLNLLARVAEEDINSISKNVTMSTRARIAQGKVLVPNVYGYISTYNKERQEYDLKVNNEQAKIIKAIFELYISGFGEDRIRKYLEEKGYRTPSGKVKWCSGTINRILKNEKYIGNTLMQKTYTENFVRKINKNDNANAPMVLIENTHESIISIEIFKRAQTIRKEKLKDVSVNKKNEKNSYVFTGKIVCGECGKHYIHRVLHYNGKAKYGLWVCNNKIKNRRQACSSNSIKDHVLYKLFEDAYNECCKNKIHIGEISKLEEKQRMFRTAEKEINSMYAKKYIAQSMYEMELADIVQELNEIESKINKEQKKEKLILPLGNGENIDSAIKKYLDKVVVDNWTVTFIFINGYQTSRRYTNGKCGGQKGNCNSIKNKKRNI